MRSERLSGKGEEQKGKNEATMQERNSPGRYSSDMTALAWATPARNLLLSFQNFLTFNPVNVDLLSTFAHRHQILDILDNPVVCSNVPRLCWVQS